MITILGAEWARIADHVRACAPEEACGFLAAYRWAPEHVVAAVPMLNVSDQPRDFYAIDHARHMEAVAALDGHNLKIMGIYHSHVDCGTYLSSHDIDMAADATKVHLVVGYVTGIGVTAGEMWQVRDGVPHPIVFERD